MRKMPFATISNETFAIFGVAPSRLSKSTPCASVFTCFIGAKLREKPTWSSRPCVIAIRRRKRTVDRDQTAAGESTCLDVPECIMHDALQRRSVAPTPNAEATGVGSGHSGFTEDGLEERCEASAEASVASSR